ncbi:MAG: hypothetical protein AB7K09_10110, partial [Planctomycetota bacterium]
MPVRDSIARQLLARVFAVYSIVILIMAAAHMAADFVTTRERIQDELRAVGRTFAPGLAQAMWDMNDEQFQPTFLG